MRIGIPTEIKPMEGRVALIPAAVRDLVAHGHQVHIQSGAGQFAGYQDEEYQRAGAIIEMDAAGVYGNGELILKVKEPYGPELGLLRKEHLLFSYLHLAANPELAQKLCQIGLTAVGFETVVGKIGELPLLIPMSDIAGRLAVQVATHMLHRPQGGKGLLLGGLAAADRGNVVILGCGVAGSNAAIMAAGMGANVTVFDRNVYKLEEARKIGPNVTALYSFHEEIAKSVSTADVLIGSVLIPGAKAPHLVNKDMVRSMQPGSVIIDIAVDQGGCIETTRPTTYEDPTYMWEGILHFGVTNMPGAVPRSACYALSSALLPYVIEMADGHLDSHTGLKQGINVRAGEVVHPALTS